MENLAVEIEQFLKSQPSHAIGVVQGNLKLNKNTAPKFSFNLQDIQTLFGDIPSFLEALPQRGYTNGAELQFKRMYPNSTTSDYIKKVIPLIFNQEEPNTMETTPLPAPVPTTSVPTHTTHPEVFTPMYGQGMGMPMGLGASDWISAKVKEERYDDLRRENQRLTDELSEYKTRLRQTELEKSSLQLKLDTAERLHELDVQKKLLEKEGFLESKGVQALLQNETFMTALGGFLIKAQKTAPVVATGLGMPNNISELKKNVIKWIASDEISDQEVNYMLQLYQQKQQKQQEQENSEISE